MLLAMPTPFGIPPPPSSTSASTSSTSRPTTPRGRPSRPGTPSRRSRANTPSSSRPPPPILTLGPTESLDLLVDTVEMLLSECARRSISSTSASVLSSPVSATDSNTHNIPSPLQQTAITRRFLSKTPSTVPIPTYLARLHKYTPHSPAVYLWSIITLHRLVHASSLSLCLRNVHRVLLAAIDVGSKMLEDHSWPHRRIAQVGGVNCAELTRLEMGFCFLGGFEGGAGLEEEAEGVRRKVVRWKVEQARRGNYAD